jgi:hypothetical protein
MKLRASQIILASCTLLCSGTAVAEDVQGSASGYRIAGNDDGFQLVEHGIWPQPERQEVLPPVFTEPVQATSRIGSHKRGSSHFRRATYLPRVYAMESKFALPSGLLDALVWTESRYNPLAVSKAGAGGLGQLMPGTARELGVSNRFDPAENLEGAARYLRQMLDEFGVVHLALAAYNAGPGAVKRAGGIPRNGETPGYVRDVLRHWRF